FTDQMNSSPKFKDEMFAVSVACMADYQELFLNRIMQNPENRLQTFMEQNPELFELIPHHYIASYLGITPVSLSRLRNKEHKQ
ncbi:MAG: Crp/Fnr family transcriptional regulator, partial [Pseudomonadota bacterium]